MYAVIKAGGKQYRVSEGDKLDIELLPTGSRDPDSVLDLPPVLVVDGDTVMSTPAQLAGVTVTARVVGQAKGPKVTGLTYKNKTRSSRRWGHRQHYSRVEITGITAG